MKKISIDELIDMVDSRYSLVTIVSRRARQIIDGSEELVRTSTTKPVAIAIEEFYEGKYQPIYDYDQYKKNLQESEASEEQASEESKAAESEEEQPNE
jgi:DNA-directed RNA polymerase subunit omega